MSGPNHVCILTTAHPTDDVRVHSKVAESLLAAGLRVSWVGPAHSTFASRPTLDPRITYYLAPPLRRRVDRLLGAARVRRLARRLPPVDWFYSPDPDAAQVAARLARGSGARVVMDVHEVYDRGMLARWAPGPLRPALGALVRKRIRRTARAVDAVVGVCQPVLDPYVDGAARGRSMVVRSTPPATFAAPTAAPQAGTPMRVMHGKATPERGTGVVRRALELGRDRLAGIEVLMIRDPATQRDLDTAPGVLAVDPVVHREMPALLATCAAGLITYGRDLGDYSLPNRLFEYMACGVAVVAPSYSPEIVAIVEREGIGLLVDCEDPVAVGDALAWLRDHPQERAEMGRRGREAFLRAYAWEAESAPLVALLSGDSAQVGAAAAGSDGARAA